MPRRIDLTGKRFGLLSVIGLTDKRAGSSAVWRCVCDCGKTVDVASDNLTGGKTLSCGCLRLEKSGANLAGPIEAKLGMVDGTNVSRLRSAEPQSNNRSGFRGVSWQKNTHGGGGLWRAVIYLRRTRYSLGLYRTPEEASEAYLEAKAHLHGDFVAWYDEHRLRAKEKQEEESHEKSDQ